MENDWPPSSSRNPITELAIAVFVLTNAETAAILRSLGGEQA